MSKFHLLLLVSVADDAELLKKELRRSGQEYDMEVVLNVKDVVDVLRNKTFDALLAYKDSPGIHFHEVITAIRKHGLDIPFIYISDRLQSGEVIKAMKQGAFDCLQADNLKHLPRVLNEAISKSKADAENNARIDKIIASEKLLAEATSLSRVGSWESDLDDGTELWSDETYRILGYSPGSVAPTLENLVRKVHPEDVMNVTVLIGEAIKKHDRQKLEFRITNSDGSIKYITSEIVIKRDKKGHPKKITGTLADMSDIRVAELNDKKAISDLVQRNKDLEQFAYIISHNLRAPVANILGVTNTLFEGNLEKEEELEFMEALSESVKKLDNIITDLNHILQVKKHVNENIETVNFSQLVDEIKSSIGVFLEEQCIMILTDFNDVPEMLSLKSYMRSIFYNLISNSIKYRKPGLAPVIEISSRKKGRKLVLAFKDNSIGIDLKKKGDQVFGLYKRFHPEHAEGKGMGLFMVKTQVETLGGRISVASEENAGTEFKIEFEIQEY